MEDSMTDQHNLPFDVSKIDDAFPMENYRDGQRKCIEYAINAFNNGKRIVVLECPTGSGKSAIGKTLMNMVQDSFYLTVTKVLQDQFTADFENVVELKGKNAYRCTLYQREGDELTNKKVLSRQELDDKLMKSPDCTNGFCRTNMAIMGAMNDVSKGSCPPCFPVTPRSLRDPEIVIPRGSLRSLPMAMQYSACPYYEQVYKAIDSSQVIMNFSSFLYQTTLTRRFGKIRDLLVIDEAHNIESQILDFVSFSLSDTLLSNHNIFIPKLDSAENYAKWFQDINLQTHILEHLNEYQRAGLTKEYDDLERLSKKLEIFMLNITRTDAEWVTEYAETYDGQKTVRSVTIKPVYAVGFADDLLFKSGKRVMLLSATILDVDVVSRSLGINRDEMAAYRMKNRFPVENRPIYVRPVAKMTGGKDKMQEWLPKLVEGVESIMEKYPDKRGIIHTHNNAIMEAIVTRIKPKLFGRLITQREFPDKKDLLMMHGKRSNSVIVAPAMHEGINLIDDLSRFQVICKVPYANFYENEQLRRRVDVDPEYYLWMTAIKLVQSYGRSIRSETDYADTYIIDEAFIRFAKDARKILPSWFLEALHYDK
jgi:Rad3-related DNA helicase